MDETMARTMSEDHFRTADPACQEVGVHRTTSCHHLWVDAYTVR